MTVVESEIKAIKKGLNHRFKNNLVPLIIETDSSVAHKFLNGIWVPWLSSVDVIIIIEKN